MLDRLAASTHRIWILIQARLHGIDNVLVLPPLDAALRSLRALSFQRARAARVGPVMAQDNSIFLVREVVGELLTGRTNVNVLLSHVAEILLAEAAFRLRIRCLRLWQRNRDAGLLACEDLLAFKVAAIGEGFDAFCPQCRLRLVGHVRELRLVGADVGHLTPQGGPLSPLLSNLMLDVLDKELEKRGHQFVRYADDCNIYVRSQKAGERVMAGIEQFLAKRSSSRSTKPRARSPSR